MHSLYICSRFSCRVRKCSSLGAVGCHDAAADDAEPPADAKSSDAADGSQHAELPPPQFHGACRNPLKLADVCCKALFRGNIPFERIASSQDCPNEWSCKASPLLEQVLQISRLRLLCGYMTASSSLAAFISRKHSLNQDGRVYMLFAGHATQLVQPAAGFHEQWTGFALSASAASWLSRDAIRGIGLFEPLSQSCQPAIFAVT